MNCINLLMKKRCPDLCKLDDFGHLTYLSLYFLCSYELSQFYVLNNLKICTSTFVFVIICTIRWVNSGINIKLIS